MKWYSVKKYRPLVGGEYIVTDGDFLYAANYQPSECWMDTSDESILSDITHFYIPGPVEIEE